jgi:hypothetical protein
MPLNLGKARKMKYERPSSRFKKNFLKKTACVLLILVILFSNPFISSIAYRLEKNGENRNVKSRFVIPRVKAIDEDDLVIGEGKETTFQDLVITPSGDIVVEEGGKLVLRGTIIVFNHTGFYEHGIFLENGSTLEIYDSQIVGLDNLFFFNAHNATIIVDNSTFRRTHAICSDSTRITIRGSHLWALHCLNDTKVDATDADLSYLLLMGDSSAQIDGSQMIEIILYDRSHVSVSNTSLRFIFYFDEGTATISDCAYEDEIRFEPSLCDLTILVQDEETLEPVPAVDVYLNRSKGDEVASSHTGDEGAVSFNDVEEGDYMVELVGDGYASFSVRISVLNETQQETLFMSRLETEVDAPSLKNPLRVLTPSLIAVAFVFLLLGVIFRSGVKDVIDRLRQPTFAFNVPMCTRAR